MRHISAILLISTLASCDIRDRPHGLTLADVRFPDPEKEAIVRNGICEIIAYDTAEIFSRAPRLREYYGRTPKDNWWPSRFRKYLGYEVEFRNYDTLGNITFRYNKRSLQIMCGYGVYPHYEYDTLGFLSHNWKRDPTHSRDTFWYFILPKEHKFGKVHRYVSDRPGTSDTTIYTLNDDGFPLLGTHWSRSWTDTGWEYYSTDTTWYRYSNNLLIEVEYHHPDRSYRDNDIEVMTRYYYTNSKLDSMIETQRYPHSRWSYPNVMYKTFYDEQGLPRTGLIADSLHVYYVLKKCGDTTIMDHSEW